MIASIHDLFHPHDPSLIEAALLDHRRLHLSGGRADALEKLLPWDVFNTLPDAQQLFANRLRVTQRSREIPFDLLAPPAAPNVARRLRGETLQSLCEQGVSLVIDQVEAQVPAIAALCAMIERHFSAAVSANCYASFHRSSAFAPHIDDHDVLVLQLHGSKRWFFHGQPHRFPVAGADYPVPDDPGEAEAEVMMAPGDILFVPRGEVHWAEAEAAASMHLSVGLRLPRGKDLLRWLGRRAEAEQIAREDISRLEDAEAQGAREEALREMLHRLADTLDLSAFFAGSDRARAPMRPLNLGHLQQLATDTLVLASLRRRVPIPADGQLALPGGAVRLSEGERAVLERLLERDGWTVDRLEAALPDAREAVSALAAKALVFLFPPD